MSKRSVFFSYSLLIQFLPILFCVSMLPVYTDCFALDNTFYMPDDCANVQACAALMAGGDTLIIRDGTYTGDENKVENSIPNEQRIKADFAMYSSDAVRGWTATDKPSPNIFGNISGTQFHVRSMVLVVFPETLMVIQL